MSQSKVAQINDIHSYQHTESIQLTFARTNISHQYFVRKDYIHHIDIYKTLTLSMVGHTLRDR